MNNLMIALIASGFATVAAAQTPNVDTDAVTDHGAAASSTKQSELSINAGNAVNVTVANEERVAAARKFANIGDSAASALDAAGSRIYEAPTAGVIDTNFEPGVAIRNNSGQSLEEARVDGHILWIRMTSHIGRPYLLVPTVGAESFIRRDSLDTGLKVALWLLYSF